MPKPPMDDDAETAATMPAEDMAPATDAFEDEAPMEEPQGYMLALKVTPSGMLVCKKPLPAEAEPEDGSEYEEIKVDSIEQGLKAIFALYKQDPQGKSEQEAFNAGFSGGGSPQPAADRGGY